MALAGKDQEVTLYQVGDDVEGNHVWYHGLSSNYFCPKVPRSIIFSMHWTVPTAHSKAGTMPRMMVYIPIRMDTKVSIRSFCFFAIYDNVESEQEMTAEL